MTRFEKRLAAVAFILFIVGVVLIYVGLTGLPPLLVDSAPSGVCRLTDGPVVVRSTGEIFQCLKTTAPAVPEAAVSRGTPLQGTADGE